MGGCLSCGSGGGGGGDQRPCAYVVSVSGELRQFPLPITVSQVLDSDSKFFLCNSDALYFDDYIPSLPSNQQLEPCQLYFVLPNAKLQYRLAASEMAALALKASLALHQINAGRSRNNKTRISPVLVSEEDPQSNHTVNFYNKVHDDGINKKKKKTAPNLVSRSGSGSVRKLTRYSSQRAKLAVRSFRMKLTTIYEGSVLHPNL